MDRVLVVPAGGDGAADAVLDAVEGDELHARGAAEEPRKRTRKRSDRGPRAAHKQRRAAERVARERERMAAKQAKKAAKKV